MADDADDVEADEIWFTIEAALMGMLLLLPLPTLAASELEVSKAKPALGVDGFGIEAATAALGVDGVVIEAVTASVIDRARDSVESVGGLMVPVWHAAKLMRRAAMMMFFI